MTDTSSTTPSTRTSTSTTGTATDVLPAVVLDFLDAHAVRDVTTGMRAFAPDAVVTDEGRTFRGADEVGRFLAESGAEFTYTTQVLGASRTGDGQWLVAVRIEGDFPGGVADLGYRFTLREGLVSELHIGT
ncbi:nuclear transport factor 2 family protein [Aquipuribacter hungaricus]|uniref:Nuclear transport factor 2 family protein n=1 Tax=Aquipuribacter hungaricus TaxID=545624 RepID=A0ABV7WEF4_9MICO